MQGMGELDQIHQEEVISSAVEEEAAAEWVELSLLKLEGILPLQLPQATRVPCSPETL